MKPPISTRLFAVIGCVLFIGHAAEPAESAVAPTPVVSLPVTLTLAKPGFVTAVINSDNFNGAMALAMERAATATGPNRVYFLNSVGLCTINEKDRHEVLLKLTPLKPFPVIDTYSFLDLAVQNGPAVILNSRPPSAHSAWAQQGSSHFCPRSGGPRQ